MEPNNNVTVVNSGSKNLLIIISMLILGVIAGYFLNNSMSTKEQTASVLKSQDIKASSEAEEAEFAYLQQLVEKYNEATLMLSGQDRSFTKREFLDTFWNALSNTNTSEPVDYMYACTSAGGASYDHNAYFWMGDPWIVPGTTGTVCTYTGTA